MNARTVVRLVERVVESVVGQADDEQILPLRKLFQPVDEFPQAVVGKCKGIQNLVVQPVIGHIKRLVAAQRKESRVPKAVCGTLLYLVIQILERDVIVHSPRVLALAHAEIHICRKALVTTSQQITLHVGEIDVSAV